MQISNLSDIEKKYEIKSVEKKITPYEYFEVNTPYGSHIRPVYSTSVEFFNNGFERLIDDLRRGQEVETSKFIEEIRCLPDFTNETKVIVVRFDLNKVHLETIQVIESAMKDAFPEKKIVFIPVEFDVFEMGKTCLTNIRDQLSEIIEDLNYDHIMGF